MSFTIADKSGRNPYQLPKNGSSISNLLKNKNIIAGVLNFTKGKELTFKVQGIPKGNNTTFSDNLFNKAGRYKKANWLLQSDGNAVVQHQ